MGFEDVRWSRLVEVKRINSGGMAELFLAERVSPFFGVGSPLVIKRVHPKLRNDPSSKTLFAQEAQIHSLLNHPNIVQFYDLGAQGEEFYLAVEYVDGGDLNQLRQIMGNRSQAERTAITLQLLREIGSAFDYMHDKAIHQDVSAENILFSKSGAFKLCDFGLAKQATDDTLPILRLGQGKFRYMSPEQISGAKIDHRSDIFSLGLCAAELFSGHKLHEELPRKDLLRLLRQGSYLKYVLDLEIPAGLKEIIDRCIQPSPRDRFQTALEMVRATCLAQAALFSEIGPCSLRESLLRGPFEGHLQKIPGSKVEMEKGEPEALISTKWSKLLIWALASPILPILPCISFLKRRFFSQA